MKRYRITVNGQSYDVGVEEIGGATSSFASAPAPVPGAAPAAVPVVVPAAAPAMPAAAPVSGAGAAVAGAISVKAPMPGTVMSFKVVVGQAVKRGDVLLILEAMKMENEIVAPQDGKV
ncbi:MAG: biotin/lipoyl-containing protein, partial [Rectinemataceae bacterium]